MIYLTIAFIAHVLFTLWLFINVMNYVKSKAEKDAKRDVREERKEEALIESLALTGYRMFEMRDAIKLLADKTGYKVTFSKLDADEDSDIEELVEAFEKADKVKVTKKK